VLRLKLMSGLDISEKRLPQDGRFNIKLRNTAIDVRISTMPTQHGESVVMRLLAQNTGCCSSTSWHAAAGPGALPPCHRAAAAWCW
jgi:MSHA biogenesis protein MshE